MLIAPLSVVLFYVAGGNIRHLLILGIICSLFSVAIYSLGKHSGTTDRNTLSYITDRVDNFFSDNKTAISNSSINYQTKQGLITIGSGGFFGLGFGKSIQKFGYLPEVQGDFIFSVIVEELGFIGACFLIF
jgi:cell division protein FtsW